MTRYSQEPALLHYGLHSFIFYCLLLGSQSLLASDQIKAEIVPAKKLILSIGISQFSNKVWHPLRYARKDAEDMFRYFTKHSPAFDGAQLLTDQSQKLTRKTLIKGLQTLAQDNRSEDDLVIVYISSHGTVAYKNQGRIGRYIITYDSDPKNMQDTALDYDQLIELFRGLKSRKKVLILAFCHSGIGKSALSPEMKKALRQLKSPFFEEPIQERSEGSIILTASAWREPALEDERLQNDVYTHFLLKGFSNDRNNDGAVSITEAHSYAAEATYEYTQGRQRPSAILEVLGSDPILVSGTIKKPANTASLFSLMDRFSNLNISIDGKELGILQKGLTVPEGNVRLTVSDPTKQEIISDRVVNFIAGREYSIAEYLTPNQPHGLSLGMSLQRFTSKQLNKAYTPTLAEGIQLRYTEREAYGLNDLSADVIYYPELKETIELRVFDGTLQKFKQRRQMLGLRIEASRRSTLSLLSSNDGTMLTEAKASLGLSNLNIMRDPEEKAFFQQKKTAAAFGFSSVLGLESSWIYNLLRIGAELRLDVLSNFTSEGDPVLISQHFAAYLGSYW